MDDFKNVKVVGISNSLYVSLTDFLNEWNIKKGDIVKVRQVKDEIIIKK